MRNIKVSSWLLICTLLTVLHHKGFTQPVNPRFETISVNEGLSQSSVYSILQDKKGFMWFGTGDGLNRFDGESIKIFKARNIAIANSNIIRGRICEDAKGRIWYANETGIYHFNPVTERVDKSFDFTVPNGDLIYYFAVLIDGYQTLWLLDPVKGPVKFSIPTGKPQLIPFPDDVSKTEFSYSVEPAGGFIFFHFSNRKGILRFEIATQKYDWVFTEFRNAKVKRGNKEMFLIREGGIDVIDSVTHAKHFIPLPERSDVRSVLRDTFGRVWIATNEKGIYCYFPESDRLINYSSDKSKLNPIPIDLTTSLFIDATNNLWVGTDGGGVARLDIKPPRFNIFPFDEGEYPYMKDFFTRCLYEDVDGRIWFGTLNNGFSILNPDNGQVKNFSKLSHDVTNQQRNTVTAVFRDDRGVIWVGHNNGISIFNEQRNSFQEIQLNLPDYIDSSRNSFYHIIQLQGGDLLVGTYYGVIQISKRDDTYKGIMKSDTSAMTITFLKEVQKDHIWLTSPIKGLIHLRFIDGGFVFMEKFFEGYDLRSLHVDERDSEILWVCSGAGLIKFNTSSHEYKIYNEEHGMLGSYIYGALEDANHNLWMSTNTGLCFFDRSTETFQNFTFKDGLQSNEFNTGAFYKGASGTLYFGGIKGFNWFKTGTEKFEGTPPKIALTSILVNHQAITKDTTFSSHKSLTLHHTENDLAFEMAVLNYTRPKANRIQYKLEGWENEWRTTFTKNVHYSNLPPGRYTFRVRGSNGGELWGEEESIPILIKAPIWKTNWFYAVMGVVLIGSIIGITRSIARRKLNLKLHELEKQHAVMHERERIRKDIHDDLGSGLSKIAILSELARQSGSQEEFSKRQLDKISESSRQLIDSLGELIWSNNPANDTLEKLFWYLREHLGAMFEESTISFSISLPEFIPDVQIQAEWRRNIFLIIKESLHNVLKHSEATEVKLIVDVKKGVLHVSVQDNGCGFDVEKKTATGNGLGNISNRVKDCEGRLNISSIPGNGTTVQFEAPIEI